MFLKLFYSPCLPLMSTPNVTVAGHDQDYQTHK